LLYIFFQLINVSNCGVKAGKSGETAKALWISWFLLILVFLFFSGREVKAVVTQEGNKFVSIQTAKKPEQKSTKVVREFKETEVIQTMEVIGTDVVCVQTFKRL
jgi:hypothetical protein